MKQRALQEKKRAYKRWKRAQNEEDKREYKEKQNRQKGR